MKVLLNGDEAALAEGCTVLGLVEQRLDTSRGVAVAVNAEVVPKSTWASHRLLDGDRVELLTAAQGG